MVFRASAQGNMQEFEEHWSPALGTLPTDHHRFLAFAVGAETRRGIALAPSTHDTAATVVGNLLVQAPAVGAIGSAEEIRRIGCWSYTLYEPQDDQCWQDYYRKYLRLVP